MRLPWGSRALITTSVDRIVTAPGLLVPDTFRPWRSSRLRRFLPRSTLRVYFTPQPLPGFTLQGISLSHSHDVSSTPLCHHAGSLDYATAVARRSARRKPTPWRCSMRESVVKTSGVSRRLARSLPEFSLFQVLLSLPVPAARYLPLIAL